MAKEEQLPAVEKAILWHLDNGSENSALQQLIGHILREAYKTGKLTAEYEELFIFNIYWSPLSYNIYQYLKTPGL